MVSRRIAKLLLLLLITVSFSSCGNPFGGSSFLHLENLDSIFTKPFKDTPVKYGDVWGFEKTVTDSSTSSTYGYEISATIQEISDSQSTITNTSSTPGYLFTEVYIQ